MATPPPPLPCHAHPVGTFVFQAVGVHRKKLTAAALAICGTCDVRQACLDRRLAEPDMDTAGPHEDVVGGTTKGERRAMRDAVRPECGTVNGYRWHARRQIPSCVPCRAAWAAYTAARPVQPEHHGTRTGYGYGCRCDACKAAHARYTLARRQAGRSAGAAA